MDPATPSGPEGARRIAKERPVAPAPQTTPHHVAVMVRQGCGSCVRVVAQVRPIVAEFGASLQVVDVDEADTPSLALEFGDRVPVVLVDDEELACWEVDDADLRAALGAG